MKTLIGGIDLAWGSRNPDGICFFSCHSLDAKEPDLLELGVSRGDETLFVCIDRHVSAHDRSLLCVDAPLVCPNPTGSRPVDRLTQSLFHRQHAGCHPTNRGLCLRPLAVMERLRETGFSAGWDWAMSGRLACEIYPHPAIVRWFGLSRIVKYKRGTVLERSREFQRLQILLKKRLREEAPILARDQRVRELLAAKWSKPVEDATDALIAAMIGLQHVRGGGTEVLGDLDTGFILLPRGISG